MKIASAPPILPLLSILFFFAISNSAEGHHDRLSPIVHVINGLPENSPDVSIHCKSANADLGYQNLKVGDDYKWVVAEEQIHYCLAVWKNKFASIHAFQPRRDFNKATVFWLVKKDGFFLSWDKSTWVKKSVWETE